MTIRPPCWPPDTPAPNHCARQLHSRVVYNLTPLHGPWEGWKLAGARLVSPSGDWISADTLDRWLWRESRLYRDG